MSNTTPVYRNGTDTVNASPRAVAEGGVSLKVGNPFAVNDAGDQPDFGEMAYYEDYYIAWLHTFWKSGGFSLAEEGKPEIVCTADGLYLFQTQAMTYGDYSSHQQLDILLGPKGDFSNIGVDYQPGVLVGQTFQQFPEDGGQATAQTVGIYPCQVGDKVRVRYVHSSEHGRSLQPNCWLTATQIGAYVSNIPEIPSW